MPGRFAIDETMAIATAGSCFAQHVAKQLVQRGFKYMVTEPGPKGLFDDDLADRNYGIFPARFGNVYTTPQLVQLFERAFERFTPIEDHWLDDGRYYDPLRPFIEPEGFASLDALHHDRKAHLAAVREMFERCDIFVFTLGLTEGWRDRRDGTVYPTCPGCSVGTFDPARYEFVNFGVRETTDSLFEFIRAFGLLNPRAKVILTVSPVPLLATMSVNHVVQATTYSKSVLRVSAEEARSSFAHVDYFPSYEVITATQRTHVFFAGDGRTVTPAGVKRAMDLFFAQYAGTPAPPPEAGEDPSDPGPPTDDVVCDEETALSAI
ncbi:MAG TPA: GSCFA domain-containing protein [Candidatus Baltobacteraceae bacterium]|jgi:hypothetical protein